MRKDSYVTQHHQHLPQQRPCQAKGYVPDATCSTTTPSQTEVIVVPLHPVHPDRGQEAGSGTPPPPLVPFRQSSACPETSSASLHLTFPTLDDFIPPHLQKGPQHNQTSSASGTGPHLRPQLPSLSPSPSLISPAAVTEPESMGVAMHTVSLATRWPDCSAKFMCPDYMTFLISILNFEREAPCQQHDN
uniref:Uncharacterized protein n=1 Tax=Sphaerodactylus townsendi TaxID=933632 RepID=A0ACB8F796_9SAUR